MEDKPIQATPEILDNIENASITKEYGDGSVEITGTCSFEHVFGLLDQMPMDELNKRFVGFMWSRPLTDEQHKICNALMPVITHFVDLVENEGGHELELLKLVADMHTDGDLAGALLQTFYKYMILLSFGAIDKEKLNKFPFKVMLNDDETLSEYMGYFVEYNRKKMNQGKEDE